MMEDRNSRSNPTVLVVDDEAHIVRVVAFKLRAAGLHVLEASDGEEAWSILREGGVDLLLTDHQMPLLDGLGLARRLAEDGRFADLPVIMLTARGFRLSPTEIAGSRIAEMLSKPFSPRLVLERVQTHLDDAGDRRAAA